MQDEEEEIEGETFKTDDGMDDMPEGMNDFGILEESGDDDPENRYS